MSNLQILLVLGVLWVWLGFNLSNLRDRFYPDLNDWVPLVLWFLLIIIPTALIAWNAQQF